MEHLPKHRNAFEDRARQLQAVLKHDFDHLQGIVAHSVQYGVIALQGQPIHIVEKIATHKCEFESLVIFIRNQMRYVSTCYRTALLQARKVWQVRKVWQHTLTHKQF